jgi:hypothetical protein
MEAVGSRRGVVTRAARHAAETTAEERVAEALRLGELCLDVFLANLPEGTTREEARRRAQRVKGFGRRRGGGRPS